MPDQTDMIVDKEMKKRWYSCQDIKLSLFKKLINIIYTVYYILFPQRFDRFINDGLVAIRYLARQLLDP